MYFKLEKDIRKNFEKAFSYILNRFFLRSDFLPKFKNDPFDRRPFFLEIDHA
jgi:hypothetical protein